MPKRPAEWVRLYGCRKCWGVRIEAGMRLKDLPPDLRMVAEKHEGALEPLRFRNGTFFFVRWVSNTKAGWPDPIEIEVLPGDYLVETPSGGIDLIRNIINEE